MSTNSKIGNVALALADYAAVSWADAATGKILDELDSLDLTSNTMVVLHSDHGWHLGEYVSSLALVHALRHPMPAQT